MSVIAIFGATGYSGRNLAAEASTRGHQVVAVARAIAPAAALAHVDARPGSLFDEPFVREIAAAADVLVVALQAQGSGLAEYIPTLGRIVADNDVRLGVVGGAGNLRVSADGPPVLDTPVFPEEWREHGEAHAQVIAALRALPDEVDWFSLAPAPLYSSDNPGERTENFRVGDDLLLAGEDGSLSYISGSDYAIGFLDEIDKPSHHRVLFTVAY